MPCHIVGAPKLDSEQETEKEENVFVHIYRVPDILLNDFNETYTANFF